MTRSRLLSLLTSLLLVPLLAGCIMVCGGCFAIIVGGDDPADTQGQVGSGGSMTIHFDDHDPFGIAVSETEVTLLVRGRTIILPHTRGTKGVPYREFDYGDDRIEVDLGHGVKARVDGIHLDYGGHHYVLGEPATYRFNAPGGGFTLSER